jgi:hypothetical protein
VSQEEQDRAHHHSRPQQDTHDSHLVGVDRMDRLGWLVEVWDSGHAWAPEEVFERALSWVEAKSPVESDYDDRLADAYRPSRRRAGPRPARRACSKTENSRWQ